MPIMLPECREVRVRGQSGGIMVGLHFLKRTELATWRWHRLQEEGAAQGGK
jgi:hypothetical protein